MILHLFVNKAKYSQVFFTKWQIRPFNTKMEKQQREPLAVL